MDMPPSAPSAQADPWAIFRRPPVIIAPVDRASVEAQWDRFAAMTPEERVALTLEMSRLALQQRRERLQRRFPEADARGISWAVVREILQLEPGTEPVPR